MDSKTSVVFNTRRLSSHFAQHDKRASVHQFSSVSVIRFDSSADNCSVTVYTLVCASSSMRLYISWLQPEICQMYTHQLSIPMFMCGTNLHQYIYNAPCSVQLKSPAPCRVPPCSPAESAMPRYQCTRASPVSDTSLRCICPERAPCEVRCV